MQTKLPVKVRMVRRAYGVHIVAKLPRNQAGYVNYRTQRIELAERGHRRLYKPAEMRDTFWHESVHTLLHELGYPRLRDNETFVTRFATALSKMIDSAKF
jgi:hypothetical protein